MADKEKLKPCPFCGENKVRKNGDNYQVWCINDDCPDRDFISVDKWQNAYCWKELAKRDAIIKAVKDALYSYHSHQHRLCICALGKSCSAASGTDFYLANQALSEIERLKKEQP